VVFDVGGVLLEWNRRRSFPGSYPDAGLRTVMLQLSSASDWLALDRGTLDNRPRPKRIRERTSTRDRDRALLNHEKVLRPIPESLALLADLAKREVPLYCLSNMALATINYLRERHEFICRVSRYLISGEEGVVKPERKFSGSSRRFGIEPLRTFSSTIRRRTWRLPGTWVPDYSFRRC